MSDLVGNSEDRFSRVAAQLFRRCMFDYNKGLGMLYADNGG